MENKKICSNCQAENRAEFQFCIHCGARLPAAAITEPPAASAGTAPVPQPPVPQTPAQQPSAETATPQPETAAAQQTVETPGVSQPAAAPAAQPVATPAQPAAPFYAPQSGAAELSEIDTVAAFIGPNGYDYAHKMKQMQLEMKKASWNWPVFLFGFLLNLPFVWFYYRRMFKQGTVILLATLAFFFSNLACIYGLMSPIVDAVTELSAAYSSGNHNSTFVGYQTVEDGSWLDEDYNYGTHDYYSDDFLDDNAVDELVALLTPKMPQILFCLILLLVLFVGRTVFVVLLSCYANHMYKKHCAKKLHMLKTTTGGQYDAFMLRRLGGTSTAAGVVSGILMYIGMNIIDSALLFSSTFSFIFNLH